MEGWQTLQGQRIYVKHGLAYTSDGLRWTSNAQERAGHAAIILPPDPAALQLPPASNPPISGGTLPITTGGSTDGGTLPSTGTSSGVLASLSGVNWLGWGILALVGWFVWDHVIAGKHGGKKGA